MASKLTERDKNVLDANLIDIVGNKPYENGKWGTKNEDFVYLEIYDVNDNLIQYENLPVSQFILNSENDNVEFYPGSNIRSLGFESGTFKLKYNFLRKLAGDESAVLVHTVDKNNTKIGDIYTNQNKLHITEDGIVFAATEQEYKDSPTTAEQLAVEDLRYQIHEVSPSRTEVRLIAKQINGTYIDDFVNIQTKNIYQSVDVKISFIGGDIYQTKTLAIAPETNDFVFNQQMVNGTLTIPEVYKVDEIESAVRSGFNIIENGTFEILETDTMGNITKLSEKYDWDSELHEDAVRAVSWHYKGGYRGHGGVFTDTEHIGYHAKIVQREGIANGNALKFTDNNAMFESVPGWPAGNFYRNQLLRNDNVPTLSSLGVKAGDFINVRMDIKSTVPGKGARALFSYPDEIITEEQPTSPPTGYFNPESSGPTEPMPSSPPPGYQQNSTANASAIESKPSEMESQIIQQYDLQTIGFKKVGRPGTAPKDVEIGDTTANTTIAGEGAWKIINMFDDGNPEDGPSVVHTWGPNLQENLQIGVLSSGEEWTWNGSLWVASPANTNVPTPPENTVNNIKAVNHHPYVVKGGEENYTGKSYYPRKRRPGQNRGWQTGTFLYDNQSDNGQLFDNTTGTTNGSTTTLLFKDDLVWGTEFGSESSDTLMLWEFDELFPDVREVIVDSTTNKTLYDDIFEKGFIQSVTNVNEGTGGTFVVFYNNGDTLEDGTAHPDSNRFFQMRHNNNYEVGPEKDGKKVHLLSEINELLNQEVLESTTKLEVAFSSWTRNFDNSHGGSTAPGFWFFTADNVHWAYKTTFFEIFGVNMNLTTTYDEDGEKFKGLRRGYFPDVMIGHGPQITEAPQEHHHGKENYFLAYSRNDPKKLYRTVGTSGANYYEDINDIFFNTGVLGTRGAPLTYGVRNPAAENFGRFGGEQGDGERLGTAFTSPFIGFTVASNDDEWKHIVYHKSEKAIYDFAIDPLKIGTQSSLRLWTWDGYEWVDSAQTPPRYSKTQGNGFVMAPTEAGKWETVETSWEVPFNWKLDQDWVFYIQGNNMKLEGYEPSQGIVWVDNVFVDFTYTDQSETREVLKPYKAQINSISSDGLSIQVNKSFKDVAMEVGQDDVDLSTPDIYDLPVLPDNFNNFYVTYFNLNPRDLRTYLKFDNQMFLTTNFKQDLISVTDYPNSVVYKLYEPLPTGFEKFDECTVVKEMANPLEEIINVVDFIPEEEPKLVLRTPDLNNVESPVQRRTTQYKSMNDILTVDSTISGELKNEFLSQSLDSVEINTDYSRYENFINFSSIETRLRNFKSKLENIESYGVSSGSYVGVSGSSADIKLYHYKIEETKNNLDDFERYMYFESSSYDSGSLGISYDNSWPKTGGSGTGVSPYVLAPTTSTLGRNWFNNAITSASLYDEENNNKLSTLLPEFIKFDESNLEYLKFTDMIGQHFDHIWEYINALSDTYDRRDKLDEGISKDLLYNVAKSLGWNLDDGKDLIDLPRYALGKQVTGSAYSSYSETSERDISREIWSRIVNNMPFFLKNKGTVRALKGLINIYGIPSTILRIKEYGGPNLTDSETPQYEITRKFTKALDFRGGQSVKVAWANDGSSGRKPDTIELRFRAATGSNQILVEKQDSNNQNFFIRLKDNGSSDNYGYVSFMLSGSQVGADIGQYKEITSSALPIYDGDFYSVMVNRVSGSDNTAISQSYKLDVGKYDSSRSKIHLYSTSTMDVTQAASSSFSNAWTGSGDIYIGGSGSLATVGAQFSGSIMEYRQWTETLNTSSFKNHIANPKAYDGNSISSSYENLVLRYSFDDNKNLASDSEGIRDVSSNQTTTLSGSHTGFTGNFFRSVVDEQKTFIPSIGALRRTTNKVRIESNSIKTDQFLNPNKRATDSAYDTAPNDSNRVGIWFAPTDVINNDIINSVGNLNFENYLGDPRDKEKLSYRGLNFVANNYWKKYTSPNNFWDYIRMIRYYDQSMYPQLRKLIPARSKPDIGLLIEPNIFERPKVVLGKTPTAENKFYSSSIDIASEVDSLITITGSYNHGSSITNYDAYTGIIDIYSYETGSSVVSSSGENLLKEASGSEARDIFMDRSVWQTLGEGIYSNVTMSYGDTLSGVKGGQQDIISGSRIYGINQRHIPYYSSSISASEFKNYSSSFLDSDLDNFSHLYQGLRNSFYSGVKNTTKTTSDGKPPIEVIISAPTKLVTTEEGDFSLTTGDGIVPDFKEGDVDDKVLSMTFEEKRMKDKGKKKGLKKQKKKIQTDQDRKKAQKVFKIQEDFNKGILIVENDGDGKGIVDESFMVNEELNQTIKDISNDGIDDGVLNNEK